MDRFASRGLALWFAALAALAQALASPVHSAVRQSEFDPAHAFCAASQALSPDAIAAARALAMAFGEKAPSQDEASRGCPFCVAAAAALEPGAPDTAAIILPGLIPEAPPPATQPFYAAFGPPLGGRAPPRFS